MNPLYQCRVAAWLALLMWPALLRAQFTFTTNNGTLVLAGYAGSYRAVTIPGTTNGLLVTGIGAHAFKNNLNLTSLTIPGSVTNYAIYAVDNCPNLTAVFFQGNAPKDAFPAAPGVFEGADRATLYYLAGTTGWKTAFDMLPTVQWNPQVLTQLVYSTNNGLLSITGYTGPGGAVVIPSAINGWPVATIGSRAFLNCAGLTAITLPNTVTNLGTQAFAGCTALTNLAIPPAAAGGGVFSNCTALTSLVLPANLAAIGESEFSDCTALTSVTIPGSITSIGAWAFRNCSSLKEVYFQGNAPLADATVFAGASNATNYYLPRTAGWGETFAGRPAVPILFTYTTNGSALTIKNYIGTGGSVAVPDTLQGLPVVAIGNSAFYGCTSLTNIAIGRNVTNIAGQAFVSCPNLETITVEALNPAYSSADGVLFDKSRATLLYYPGGRKGSYTIPTGVTRIPSYAFQQSLGLTSLTVPGSVTNLGTLAFNVDPSLTAIYFEGNAPSANWHAFTDIRSPVTVFYLPGTTGWETYLGELPTASWLPRVQTEEASFSLRTNQFGFHFTWASGKVVVVEACTNLLEPAWIAVQTNTLTGGSWYFSERQETNAASRFYRLRSQ